MPNISIKPPSLLPYQKDILSYYKNEDIHTITIVGARRAGKSYLMKILILAEFLSCKSIAIIAPTVQQLKDIYWTTLETKLKDLAAIGLDIQITKSPSIQATVKIGSKSGVIRAFSSASISRIRGSSYDLVICDEVCFWECPIKQAIENDIQPTLADRNGKLVLASSPTWKSFFYELHRRAIDNVEGYATVKIKSEQNPHISQAYIQRIKSQISEDAFRNEWEGEFLESGILVKYTSANFKRVLHQPHLRPIFAIDPARKKDFTAIIVKQGDAIIDLVRIQNETYKDQAEQIQKMVEKYNPLAIYVEANQGLALIDELAELKIRVKPIQMTYDYKVEIINKLIADLEHTRLFFSDYTMTSEQLNVIRQELDNFDYQYTKNGKITFGGEHKKSEGLEINDDTVIAIAIANKESGKALDVTNLPRARAF